VLAAATIAAQIAWPLTSGSTRDLVTVVTVVLFFLTSASHALLTRGWAWAAGWFVTSAGIGFLAEYAGTRTGLPFGDYSYADTLGPTIAGVPAIIPLAWAMMSYPALLAARRLVRGPLLTPVVAAVALASWDLFLDPQMVGEGYWKWAKRGVYRGIPLSNYLGWFVTGLAVMALLEATLPPADDARDADGALVGEYAYMGVMETIGFAKYFRDPVVAVVGGLAMVPIGAAAVVGKLRA
jgi:putative membrane protein